MPGHIQQRSGCPGIAVYWNNISALMIQILDNNA